MSQPIPYKEAFPKGTTVKVADRVFLEEFKRTWNYHHQLQTEQLNYADLVTTVEVVGFYHGGDPIYELTDAPGFWLEQCLRRSSSE
jgi:hypothetical protein